MSRFFARLIATFGFAGFLPVGPGTWASGITLALWFLLPPPGAIVLAAVLAVVLVAGTWASDRAESIYGHDSHKVVIDEVAGSLIAIVALPHTLAVAVLGFVFFRVFDIVKPPPIYQIQALRGGAGVMADDVLAGIAANAAVRIVLALVPSLRAG